MQLFKKSNNKIDFTQGKMFNSMLAFIIPMLFSMILQLLFNAVDIIVVGRCAGTEYQGAVGSTSSSISLITNLLIGCSIGANVTLANAVGAKDDQRKHKIIHCSMALAVVGGIVFMVIGLLATTWLLKVLETKDEIFHLADLYMKIYCLGIPGCMVYNFGASIYRSMGETQKPLFYLFVSGLVNVVINVVTVAGFGWHVVGVALGTVVSFYVAAVLVVLDLVKEQGASKYEIRKTRFYKKELKEILIMGLPSGISSCCFSLSNLVMQSTINTYSTAIIAGNTVAISVNSVVIAVGNSLEKATITAISQNDGAKRIDRFGQVIKVGSLISAVLGVVIGGIVLLIGKQVCLLYNSDPLVAEHAFERLRLHGGCSIIWYFGMVFSGALHGSGRSVLSMIINLVCTCLFRVFWLKLIYPLSPNVFMIYVLHPITWLLATIFWALFFVITLYKRKKHLQLESQTE